MLLRNSNFNFLKYSLVSNLFKNQRPERLQSIVLSQKFFHPAHLAFRYDYNLKKVIYSIRFIPKVKVNTGIF